MIFNAKTEIKKELTESEILDCGRRWKFTPTKTVHCEEFFPQFRIGSFKIPEDCLMEFYGHREWKISSICSAARSLICKLQVKGSFARITPMCAVRWIYGPIDRAIDKAASRAFNTDHIAHLYSLTWSKVWSWA